MCTWADLAVDGSAVRVMEAGDPCADALLFLHGWGLSPACYADGVARLTAAGVRVVAPCLPGFGGSDRLPLRRTDLRAYAQRIGRLLDVLGEQRPVFVAGHSFGGGVALQLASDRPELVRSLTLVNSVGGAGSPGPDGSWLRWAAGATTELDPRAAGDCAAGVLRALLHNALRSPVAMALTARLALTASLAAQAQELVGRGLPVLFVWGDGDRLIFPGALAEVGAPLPAQVVPGRHGWLLSDPRAFADLVRNALVVHALLERPGGSPQEAGSAVVLPFGTRLADLLPAEGTIAG